MEVSDWVRKFKKVTKKDPKKSDFKDIESFELNKGIGCMAVLELLWYFMGILSGSWFIFLTVIGLGILNSLFMKLFPLSIRVVIGFIFNLFKLGATVFLVINHFHLHLNVFSMLFG